MTIINDIHIKALKKHGNTVIYKHAKEDIIQAFLDCGYKVVLREFTAEGYMIEDNCYIVELA